MSPDNPQSIDGITPGVTYEDGITGFKGVCTGVVMYLTGCNQALIAPRDEGGVRNFEQGRWFDTSRLHEVETHQDVKLPRDELVASAPGADVEAPIR